MDFGDYVEALRRVPSGEKCFGVVVCRTPGGIGVLSMDIESGGPGELYSCQRRGARVIDLFAEDEATIRSPGIETRVAEFIDTVREKLSEAWRSGQVNSPAALVDFGIVTSGLLSARKPAQPRLYSGDLLNHCLPGCYGKGKRR